MNFQINPNLDIDYLKKEFRTSSKLVIENFLTYDSVEYLYNFFTKEMPEDWWSGSFLNFDEHNSDDYGNAQFIRRTSQNSEILRKHLLTSQKKFIDGKFSYFFDRTDDDHHDECDCCECQYRTFISNESTLKWFGEVIDYELRNVGEFFASRFLPNHFLSPHHDHEKGKIATVLGLSKNWKAEWGGNLHFMKDDYKTVTKVVQPTFNKLSLFDIPSANGVPHYVSHVVPGCKYGRISYTGWYE